MQRLNSASKQEKRYQLHYDSSGIETFKDEFRYRQLYHSLETNRGFRIPGLPDKSSRKRTSVTIDPDLDPSPKFKPAKKDDPHKLSGWDVVPQEQFGRSHYF